MKVEDGSAVKLGSIRDIFFKNTMHAIAQYYLHRHE